MLDLKLLQNNFEEISKKLEKRDLSKDLLTSLKVINEDLKKNKKILEDLQANQNAKSKLFPQYAKEGKAGELKEELAQNKKAIAISQDKVREIEEKLFNIALTIPNIPDDSVPYGKDENDNIELKKILEPKKFNFKPKEHW